ncbi:alkaline phosphatase family protein [Actinospica sp. MGRD01-02]|uniref:Alkaline phosphatase family protein n=1 Tax=Actinospica acidithermotolerans TaxID=2828514 RepID=A0A941EAY6_9ACTN|nr:alkaline phosphatase family protein [Actinospica acidithermotolerans]MBR7828211.1 alkaline phosphatase family protein [Actinospica acidithermotolerans]
MHPKTKRRAAVTAAAGAVALGLSFAVAQPSFGSQNAGTVAPESSGASVMLTGAHLGTATPIQHVVVIYDENVSFDHYFGTYPNAANTDGTTFRAAANTPAVNGLTPGLLENNPNGANPTRLNPSQALTCDQDHDMTPEQKAYDKGLADKFPQYTGVANCSSPDTGLPGLVMDYYDGNTVTGLWNYAQHYAMSDDNYGSVYGPSTPGALNLISGQTYGAQIIDSATGKTVIDASTVASPNSSGVGTDIRDMDPYYDDCSKAGDQLKMSGTNVGDLLNAKHVTWGWFEGGFAPTAKATASAKAVCGASHTNVGGASISDYIAHHEPFQYYASTANPHHVAPKNEAEVGHNGQANHQYDLSYFYDSLKDGNLPSVSFVKQAGYQDGHAGYSDPIDEQAGVVNLVNTIESSKYWSSTAIYITYDDSDGWYDHQAPPNVNSSSDPAMDALDGTGTCNSTARTPLAGEQDRCGYGPRIPLLVISPYAKTNYVNHSVTDQSSILAFVEQNWSTGTISGSFDQVAGSLDPFFDFGKRSARRILLSPTSGAVLRD